MQGEPNAVPDYFPGDLPKFEIGQRVKHRRYTYRGLVVDFDMACQADDTWYETNQTQPDREQPWYHVLVHGTTRVTYAAESSLEPDPTNQPVDHPLVTHFFEVDRQSGAYARNDEPWPGWEG